MDDVSVSNSELLETTDSEDDTTDVSDDKLHKEGESESLSDIDDAEVGSYLYDEKEKHYRKQIWEMMNKKYLQEQAERVAAAANGTKFKRVKFCFGGCELGHTGFQKFGSNTWVLEMCNQR